MEERESKKCAVGREEGGDAGDRRILWDGGRVNERERNRERERKSIREKRKEGDTREERI